MKIVNTLSPSNGSVTTESPSSMADSLGPLSSRARYCLMVAQLGLFLPSSIKLGKRARPPLSLSTDGVSSLPVSTSSNPLPTLHPHSPSQLARNAVVVVHLHHPSGSRRRSKTSTYCQTTRTTSRLFLFPLCGVVCHKRSEAAGKRTLLRRCIICAGGVEYYQALDWAMDLG